VEVNNSVRVFTFVPDNLGALTVSARRVENWGLAHSDGQGEEAYLVGHIVTNVMLCVYERGHKGEKKKEKRGYLL
jgi:hypothetical protein